MQPNNVTDGGQNSLIVKDICFAYNSAHPILDGITLEVAPGELVGLVGPSGCGKSTLARVVAGLEKTQRGDVYLGGNPLTKKGYSPIQLIHQHPEHAVNPRWKLGKTICEGWDPTPDVLASLGIESEWLNRWPNELSGGELQRFCVARALGPKTRFLIADEMSTMLDVITQAQLWEFVIARAHEQHMGVLVITHDTALANRVCTRILHFEEL